METIRVEDGDSMLAIPWQLMIIYNYAMQMTYL